MQGPGWQLELVCSLLMFYQLERELPVCHHTPSGLTLLPLICTWLFCPQHPGDKSNKDGALLEPFPSSGPLCYAHLALYPGQAAQALFCWDSPAPGRQWGIVHSETLCNQLEITEHRVRRGWSMPSLTYIGRCKCGISLAHSSGQWWPCFYLPLICHHSDVTSFIWVADFKGAFQIFFNFSVSGIIAQLSKAFCCAIKIKYS